MDDNPNNQKKFGDEDFIYMQGMETEKPAHENNIHDGFIIIDDEKIPVKRRAVLNGKISVIIPETFTVMDKEIAKIKYPSESRPDLIFTNEETTINFTLTHKDDEVSNEDIPEMKDIVQQIVMRMYPASSVIDSETITIEASGKNISYFDFVTSAIDTDIYNVSFMFSFEERAVVGGFNCPSDEMSDWKPVFVQMMDSVEAG